MLQSSPMQAPPMQSAPVQTQSVMQSGVGMPVSGQQWGGQMMMGSMAGFPVMQPGLLPMQSDIQNLQAMEDRQAESTVGHMKYCQCDLCLKAKNPELSKPVQSESPQKNTNAAPTNLTCTNSFCQAVRDVKQELDVANATVDRAQSDLDAELKLVEIAKLEALKNEREAEKAKDTLSELQDKHKKMVEVLPAGNPERVNLEQALAKAEAEANAALSLAAAKATEMQIKAKRLPELRTKLMTEKMAQSAAFSKWTVEVCKAAASCSTCTWFEELETALNDKCSYACTKCGFKADFYDVDQHQAVCAGDKSKFYFCVAGCGFQGEFEVVEKHERLTCPLRGQRAFTGPAPVVGPTRQSGIYSSQTLPSGFAAGSQPLYTSATNIQVGGPAPQRKAE